MKKSTRPNARGSPRVRTLPDRGPETCTKTFRRNLSGGTGKGNAWKRSSVYLFLGFVPQTCYNDRNRLFGPVLAVTRTSTTRWIVVNESIRCRATAIVSGGHCAGPSTVIVKQISPDVHTLSRRRKDSRVVDGENILPDFDCVPFQTSVAEPHHRLCCSYPSTWRNGTLAVHPTRPPLNVFTRALVVRVFLFALVNIIVMR
jgi:hypothetical protein